MKQQKLKENNEEAIVNTDGKNNIEETILPPEGTSYWEVLFEWMKARHECKVAEIRAEKAEKKQKELQAKCQDAILKKELADKRSQRLEEKLQLAREEKWQTELAMRRVDSDNWQSDTRQSQIAQRVMLSIRLLIQLMRERGNKEDEIANLLIMNYGFTIRDASALLAKIPLKTMEEVIAETGAPSIPIEVFSETNEFSTQITINKCLES